ncbi:MAG: DinB family protein [Flavobacterium sp.]|nr:DinB family protein [Flavobacterium sp.]
MKINDVIFSLQNEVEQLTTLSVEANDTLFFSTLKEGKWSIAEHLTHLALSLLPVNNLLKQPELMLERWGKSNRKSRELVVFLEDYKMAVATADWKAFPPFVPKSATESNDYLQQHSTTSEDKKNDFYQLTGETIKGLRDKFELDTNATKAEVANKLGQQYQLFFQLVSNLSDEHLEACQIPLPYVGLITCKEMIYFTYNHTKVHRMAIERDWL